jgi:hypothetical protein
MAVDIMRILADSSGHFDRKFVSVVDEGALYLVVFFDDAIASVRAICKATCVTAVESHCFCLLCSDKNMTNIGIHFEYEATCSAKNVRNVGNKSVK